MVEWEAIPYASLPDWLKRDSKPTDTVKCNYIRFFNGDGYKYQVKYDLWNDELQIYYWRTPDPTTKPEKKSRSIYKKNWMPWIVFLILVSGLLFIIGTCGVYGGTHAISSVTNLTVGHPLYSSQSSIISPLQIGITIAKTLVTVSTVGVGVMSLIGVIILILKIRGCTQTVENMGVTPKAKKYTAILILGIIASAFFINPLFATLSNLIGWYFMGWYWCGPYLTVYAVHHNKNPTRAFVIGAITGLIGVFIYILWENFPKKSGVTNTKNKTANANPAASE